jgi:Na+-driven multidrug efflux pump
MVGTSYQMSSLTGIVRPGGSIYFVLVNDLIFVWLVVIPSALLAAFVFHASPLIVFICLKSDQILKCGVAVVKVNRFEWIRNLTRKSVSVTKAYLKIFVVKKGFWKLV